MRQSDLRRFDRRLLRGGCLIPVHAEDFPDKLKRGPPNRRRNGGNSNDPANTAAIRFTGPALPAV